MVWATRIYTAVTCVGLLALGMTSRPFYGYIAHRAELTKWIDAGPEISFVTASILMVTNVGVAAAGIAGLLHLRLCGRCWSSTESPSSPEHCSSRLAGTGT